MKAPTTQTDLEAGLELGERAAPVGVGGVALDDRVEGQLGRVGAEADGEGDQRPRPPRPPRPRPPSERRQRWPPSIEPTRMSSSLRSCRRHAGAPATEPTKRARARWRRTATPEVPASACSRRSKASRKTRKPTMPRMQAHGRGGQEDAAAAQLGLLGLPDRLGGHLASAGCAKAQRPVPTANTTMAKPIDPLGPPIQPRTSAGDGGGQAREARDERQLASWPRPAPGRCDTVVGHDGALGDRRRPCPARASANASGNRSRLVEVADHEQADQDPGEGDQAIDHQPAAVGRPVEGGPDERGDDGERRHGQHQVEGDLAPGLAGRGSRRRASWPGPGRRGRRPRPARAWTRASRVNGEATKWSAGARAARPGPRTRSTPRDGSRRRLYGGRRQRHPHSARGVGRLRDRRYPGIGSVRGLVLVARPRMVRMRSGRRVGLDLGRAAA